MRHKGVNKEETRQKMVDAAGRGFRGQGYAGIGVDSLAKAAGVTSGAFYAHFGSKAGAFDIALDAGLDEVIEAVPQFQEDNGLEWTRAFSDYYLGKPHRKDLECGCAMASLTPDVVRADANVHAAFEKKMTTIVELMAAGLAGKSDEDRRARAWAMLAALIGGLNVARAMKTSKVTGEVAEAVKSTAVKVAGRTRTKGR